MKIKKSTLSKKIYSFSFGDFNKKRVGRGNSSKRGKTCGRGTKGQKSRSGNSLPIGFTGGSVPFYLSVQKYGRSIIFKYKIVKSSIIQKYFKPGDNISIELLKRFKLLKLPHNIKKKRIKIKIVCDSKFNSKDFKIDSNILFSKKMI